MIAQLAASATQSLTGANGPQVLMALAAPDLNDRMAKTGAVLRMKWHAGAIRAEMIHPVTSM